MNTTTFKVTYTKRIGGDGQIIVKAVNEQNALVNARFLCFTGSNFRNAEIVPNEEYIKPSKQGFIGSHRSN